MKGYYQIFKYPLVIIFFTIILLPTINGTFSIREFERSDENRTFRDSIELDISNLDVFPGQYEEYLNDNFSFRRPLLDAYHNIKFKYFKVSPHSDKTIIGRQGWFYMAEKEVDIFGGKLSFPDDELEKFKQDWTLRKEYLDSSNIKYYWVICPFKHNIYPEYLPFNVFRHHNSQRVDEVKAYLEESFPDMIIDPTPELLAAKDSEKVFYQLDNHWNLHAGYITSELLLSRIKQDFPEDEIADISKFNWRDTIIQNGIHYRVLGIEDLYEIDQIPVFENERAEVHEKYGFPPPKGFAYPWNYERRYINENDTSGLVILVIRDSFGNQIVPFMKEPFRESVFIFDAWRYKLNEAIIEVVKPDIVVFLTVETHLESLISDKN